MKTEVRSIDDDSLLLAARLIRAGELVGFPTETVYGLGANALDADAVKKIFLAKGRPGDNPLIVHISDLSQLSALITGEIPRSARLLAEAYWPGPLTMIFAKSSVVPMEVTAGLDTVAVRFPENADARALINLAGTPIAAPSANRSGRPSPTCAAHVFEDMDGRIPLILDGGACQIGLESTVVDARVQPVRVLRPGGVTPEMIAAVTGEAEVDGTVLRPIREGETVRSPGMKYRHYAPMGDLVIVRGERARVARTINRLYDACDTSRAIFALTPNRELYGARRVYLLGNDDSQMAGALFTALRDADTNGVRMIYAEAVPAEGIGLAVMNRLGRAAAFHIIEAE